MNEKRGMSNSQTLRLRLLWLNAIVTLGLVALSITPSIQNMIRFILMFAAPLLGFVVYLVWQPFFSGMGWRERLLTLAAFLVPVAIPVFLGESKMLTGLWLYGIPLALLILATTLTVARAWPSARRTALAGACLLVGWSLFTLGRLDGFDGAYLPEFSWRWSPTPEEQLASMDIGEMAEAAFGWQAENAEWPGFRGPLGDSRVTSFEGTLDWQSAPPRELWRVPVGPAWSSMAYADGRLFTQEQRGEHEIVSCLDAETGARIWEHKATSRFDELVSGSGPRSTPTFADGKIYALGGRGVLSALDAATGAELWQHDLMAEMDAPLPMWGFSSSPLVVAGQVIVHAGPSAETGLVAFDAITGTRTWAVPTRGMNFSSAQRVMLGSSPENAGAEHIVFADKTGLFALEPSTGDELWRYAPENWEGPIMVQPQQVGESTLITALGDGTGAARLEITQNADGAWSIEERWSSIRLKPSFNDFVIHDGHIYGYDQNIFTSVDLETGERNWKRGRYGFGQVVLLGPAGQLLIQTESGAVVLLAADPSGHRELGRLEDALDDKTWNHPIVAAGRLFVRNGREIAAFDLG